MASSARLFLAALSFSKKAQDVLELPRLRHLFRNTEVDLFDFYVAHVRKHGRAPKRSTVDAEIGEQLPVPKEPASYYRDELERRFIDLELKRAADRANESLLANPGKPDIALGVQLADLLAIRQHLMSRDLLDFRQAGDLILPKYIAQQSDPNISGIKTGWPTLDSMSAGIQDGDLVSVVGRPQLGKTWLLVYMAVQAWRAGQTVLFVSMEMKPLLIMQRLAGVITGTSIKQITKAQIPTVQGKRKPWAEFKSKIENLGTYDDNGVEKKRPPFWVLDGQLTATVADLHGLIMHLKPGVVFVDGAYLLGHPDARLARYVRVAENCDALKRVAGEGAPIIASYQFNRDAKKLKPNEAPGLEHIADSDAVAKNSSLVLGLFEDMSPEILIKRRVEVLKGRQGEQGGFYVRWDFAGMDFSEYDPAADAISYV